MHSVANMLTDDLHSRLMRVYVKVIISLNQTVAHETFYIKRSIAIDAAFCRNMLTLAYTVIISESIGIGSRQYVRIVVIISYFIVIVIVVSISV